MRKLAIAMGLLGCLGLTGCWWQSPPPPSPLTVTCHCAAPIRGSVATAAAAPVRQARPRHHYAHYAHSSRGHRYYVRGSRRYDWHKREAERSVDSYGYSSHSRRYSSRSDGTDSYGTGHYGSGYATGRAYRYGAEGHGGGACCESGSSAQESRFSQSTRVWADGYGRRHIYDQSAARHYAYQARQRIAQTPERLAPWHGYDDDWDWRTHDDGCAPRAHCDSSNYRY